ncbi:Scr1 family TA system antitoxin-like transcriptional regulator [Nocardiopsis algeriensis]|uniref:Scr1 family TA system antitoxin-like transcriptional regulator n=1 Tax=Nocardiopsis algeriensis TaxID=1478215 RepID=UPI003B43A427
MEADPLRLLGSHAAMRDRLRHLIHMAIRHDVDIQVLPFGAGMHSPLGFTGTHPPWRGARPTAGTDRRPRPGVRGSGGARPGRRSCSGP